MDTPSRTVDDFGPLPVVRPPTVPELGDVVRRAAADGQALYPVGGGTTLSFGLPPTKPGTVADLRSLDKVLDYPARDMTVTVQAGITLAELQKLLATENQRLPVDVPHPEQATLGGALAVNASGPRRLGFGTLRDYVIGISVMNDEGAEARAGGRVVKNVAGYDLCKLHVGALGTLGIITQVTLKLKPRPEEQALVTLGCPSGGVANLLDRLHGSRTRPVCVDLLNAAAARYINQQAGARLPEDPWVLVVGFEDNREAVNWQVQEVHKELAAAGAAAADARVGAAAEPLWRALGDFSGMAEARLTFKANLLPSATAAFCLAAESAGGLRIHAHAGSGIVLGHFGEDVTLEDARRIVPTLLEQAAKAQGNLVLTRCPVAWKSSLPVWGRPPQAAALMRSVKEKLDPRGLFNPGRYLSGL